MQRNAVAITGLGVISPIGRSPAEIATALRENRSGIGLLQPSPLVGSYPAGIVQGGFEDRFARLELPFLDRCQHLAILAAEQAIRDARVDRFDTLGSRAGVYYGNVNGGVASAQDWYRNLLVEGRQAARPFTAMAIMGNAGGAQIAIRNRILGPVTTHASACASSGVAIGEAARAIRDGYLDIAVAGGAEAPLVASLVGVFDGTRALAKPDPADVGRSCRPFCADRKGLVLGEGAAFLILEAEHHARTRNATIHGYLTGYGIGCDAHHIGMPESQGQVATLHAALADAGLAATDLDYLNAHATATAGGDIIEAQALATVFGSSPDAVPVSSTKGVHGHLLGATSALELLISVVAMNNSLLPASAYLDPVDPRCPLNHVGPQPRPAQRFDHALSFSCGFGGTNVALIVSRQPRSAR